MNLSQDILSTLTIFGKYAKYIPELQRRETFSEVCTRYEQMMMKRYPEMEPAILDVMKLVRKKQVLPSMRALQFAGPAIEKNESRLYNCAFLPIDDYRSFSEIMFLLLGGIGVGISVQFNHVEKLPPVVKPRATQKYLVGDSIEGWADAVRHLVSSYLGIRSTKPRFDFSDIRPKGTRLVTAGGKAPGPGPLKICLFHLEQVLDSISENSTRLRPVDCFDMVCYIADAVLAGGIRRAAVVTLFNADDEEMLNSKVGRALESNPQRARSNNSAVIVRHKVTQDFFHGLFERMRYGNTGEPGIFLTNNSEYGINPCGEIALKPLQFCNLTEVNAATVTSQEDLEHRVRVAAILGTLQAGFTDFHYLRSVWKRNTERDALIGVGMTGTATKLVLGLNLKKAAKVVRETNEEIARLIHINPAARTTTIKPSGTTSCVLGTSSGIHSWHAPYYIRRMEINKDEMLYQYLNVNHPKLVSIQKRNPNAAVIEIPQRAPEDGIIRNGETALDLLERVKLFNIEWIKPGHKKGDNRNNVSCTVSVRENEWDDVEKWMWENKESFCGLTVLPYDPTVYSQAPFEEITEETYTEMYKHLQEVDISKVIEEDDKTSRTEELACAGGACELKSL